MSTSTRNNDNILMRLPSQAQQPLLYNATGFVSALFSQKVLEAGKIKPGTLVIAYPRPGNQKEAMAADFPQTVLQVMRVSEGKPGRTGEILCEVVAGPPQEAANHPRLASD